MEILMTSSDFSPVGFASSWPTSLAGVCTSLLELVASLVELAFPWPAPSALAVAEVA